MDLFVDPVERLIPLGNRSDYRHRCCMLFNPFWGMLQLNKDLKSQFLTGAAHGQYVDFSGKPNDF